MPPSIDSWRVPRAAPVPHNALLLRIVPLLVVAMLAWPAAAAPPAPARVLVYGDSNTWGWVPVASGAPTRRYASADRWPEVMRQALGDNVEVVVNALSGRSVDLDHIDAVGVLAPDDFNGLDSVAIAVAGELPLDVVIVMLGTNDVARDQGRSAERIATGMATLARRIRGIAGGVLTDYPAPQVLVVVPPALGDTSRTPIGDRFDAGSQRTADALPTAFREALTGIQGVHVFDAGSVVQRFEGIDGIHLTATQQHALGAALAERIVSLLEVDTVHAAFPSPTAQDSP